MCNFAVKVYDYDLDSFDFGPHAENLFIPLIYNVKVHLEVTNLNFASCREIISGHLHSGGNNSNFGNFRTLPFPMILKRSILFTVAPLSDLQLRGQRSKKVKILKCMDWPLLLHTFMDFNQTWPG